VIGNYVIAVQSSKTITSESGFLFLGETLEDELEQLDLLSFIGLLLKKEA
jgi:hypothetical protein